MHHTDYISIERMKHLADAYSAAFATGNPTFFSAPGRCEIIGNHTDHNKGLVLACSVNLDIAAAAEPNGTNTVKIVSEGYDGVFTVDLADLSAVHSERGTTDGIIRGIAAGLKKHGCAIGGFNAALSGNVPKGSGLSSSAALEVLLCKIFSQLFGDEISAFDSAVISQWAENNYFGKPCGLMDQLACATGGIVSIDFRDGAEVKRIDYDFGARGVDIVVTDVHADHADLTEDYAAITREMAAVAGYFNQKYLRGVNREQFAAALPELRKELGDRPVLRAMHFFEENERVKRAYNALQNDCLTGFFTEINASGQSSALYLQNVYKPGHSQAALMGIKLSKDLLSGGAARIHGGGFGGTVLAFVPNEQLRHYTEGMERVFGKGSCTVLSVRSSGAVAVK